jgi:hypothetical protein
MIERRPFHRQLALALVYLAYVVLFCATVAGMASVVGVGGHLAVRLAITGGLLVAVAVALVVIGSAVGRARVAGAPYVTCLVLCCVAAPTTAGAFVLTRRAALPLAAVGAEVCAAATVRAFDGVLVAHMASVADRRSGAVPGAARGAV